MPKYFVIKYNHHTQFPSGTIVKLCANTFNNSNLVEKINTDERIWLMDYDIYPIVNHDNYFDWSYNINYQQLIPSDYYIYNNNQIAKLLNSNSDKWIVLDLDTNKEIQINKNFLTKANEFIPN